MSSNRRNWRGGGRGNRGQFQGSGGRGAGGGRGQFSGEDRGRGGGRGGRGYDGHRGAGGSRGQSYGEDRGRGGGRGRDYGHFQDDGDRGAGSSSSQSYGGGRGRSEGRSDYRGRGEDRGRGSRGRGGAGGGNFEPAEVVVNLPPYGAEKKDLKHYENLGEDFLKIPERKHQIKSDLSYFQEETFIVEVNYVSITFTNPKNTRVFHYDVKILPAASKSVYRSVMDVMRSRYYNTRYPAFDGECNLYAAVTPLFTGDVVLRTEGNPITLTNNGRSTDFNVTITEANSNLDMQNLNDYFKKGTSLVRPPEMQTLEIALKGNLSTRLLQVGKRAFYPTVGDFRTLSAGTELRHGLFQGFVMGKEKYLNIDVAHKGFPIAQGVLDYLKAKIGSLPIKLSTDQLDGLGRYLKGLKIQYKDPKGRLRNYKNGNLTSDDCDETTFKKGDGSDISVYQYFVDEYNYKIQHRGLPLLDTGKPPRKHYLPLELCSIAPNQTVMKAYTPEETEAMVRVCSDKPDGRKKKVLDNVSGFADLDVIIDIERANYASDDVLSKEFGIAVGKELLQVKTMVLKPPEIQYNKDIKGDVKDGIWNPKKFRTSNTLTNWVILNKEDRDKDYSEATIKYFIKTFKSRGTDLNLTIEEPLHTRSSVGSSKEDIKNDFSELKNKCPSELQLVVVVLPFNKFTASAVYEHVKCVSELKEGILTQCLNWGTLKKMKENPRTVKTTISNILLKVNAKLGGTNYILPDIADQDTMFMGADVTHPGIGSTNPSIATVIGSYDSTAFHYGMVYSVQESRCEPIIKMEDHAKSLLELYKEKSKKFPSKIYYYRDGVSEGQFEEMKRTELMAIKEAGTKLNIPKLEVTFLVAQKRHHTRLFPMGNAGDSKSGNVVAGTVINHTITHPREHDFFLVSHQSIQGTARPTKYHAIHNEIGTSDEKIESITYHLCHLFARCTRAVKYPAPTYYAHVAGKRIELHVRGTVDEEAPAVIDLLANGKVHPNVATRNPMYFI